MYLLRSAAHIICLVACFASTSALASEAFQPKGFIQNDRGEKCLYTQTTQSNSTYFHGSLKGRIGTITFEVPGCMSGKELGLDVNKMMINNVLSRWYSHADAAFKTRTDDLQPSSLMQMKGQCIQSAKYPVIGITVDYEVTNSSIVRVRHGSAVQGCTSK